MLQVLPLISDLVLSHEQINELNAKHANLDDILADQSQQQVYSLHNIKTFMIE